MGDNSHEHSQFVVCRACQKYFFLEKISTHQAEEHIGHKWLPEEIPQRFYYLTNNEVAYTLNRYRETREAINAVRLLVL